MSESEMPSDPRAADEDELEAATPPPSSAQGDPDVVVEDEYAEGRTSDPEGARRDVPAGEDYAGSGF